MNTKVIAFDVYGTILATDDPENAMPPRRGFVQFAKLCIEKGIILVTSSDNDLLLTKIDLEESGVPLEIFTEYCEMERGQPKNFKPIVDFFGIVSSELLVFGDRLDLDINPALGQGCRGVLVPVYNYSDQFDWMSQISSI